MKITKINAIIASIIFSASIITGCQQSVGNSSDVTIPSYPETIGTNIDVSGINAETKFSTLVSKINEISNILSNPSVMAPADYIYMFDDFISFFSVIAPVDEPFSETKEEDSYPETTPQDLEAKKENNYYANYQEYVDLYTLFSESFNHYKDSYLNYSNKFDLYAASFEQAGNGENFVALKNRIKEIIYDFHDDYYFDSSYADINNLVDKAKNEQSLWEEYSSYYSSRTEMHSAKTALDDKYSKVKNFIFNMSGNEYTYGTDEIGVLSGNVIYNIPANKDGTDFNMDIAKFYNDYTKIKSMDGVTGVDVVFENLAKTNISGSLNLGNLKSVKELIFGTNEEMKNLQGENLPTFNVMLIDPEVEHKNLYGTDLDVIIATYYNKGASNKYTLRKTYDSSSYYFDAREYLKQSYGSYANMYDNDTYTGKAYNLDINAALVMLLPVKNVNIVGENKTSISKAQTLTNVRVESDMSNVEFSGSTYGYGVVDFVGPAPKVTPMSIEGKVILSSPINQEITVSSAASLDLTKLSSTDIINLITKYGCREVLFKDEAAYSQSYFPNVPDVIFVNGLFKAGDPSKAINASNEEWEQAGLTEDIP